MTDPLPINEIFETIQGEGHWSGTPAVFVRLQGCDVGCPWCDTKHTWDLDPRDEIPVGAMLVKDGSSRQWAMVPVSMIAAQVQLYRSRHVVITGGEPCVHDLTPLTTSLIEQTGRDVQIETSGTYPVLCHPKAWITVAPKLDMPGGLDVRADVLARANEIKMPVGKPDDVMALLDLMDRHSAIEALRVQGMVSLQPLSLSAKATRLCAANAIANGFRVSLQTHALVAWR